MCLQWIGSGYTYREKRAHDGRVTPNRFLCIGTCSIQVCVRDGYLYYYTYLPRPNKHDRLVESLFASKPRTCLFRHIRRRRTAGHSTPTKKRPFIYTRTRCPVGVGETTTTIDIGTKVYT